MRIESHPLLSPSVGTSRELLSFRYGEPGIGEKIYLQGSLHADEPPGMLVLFHLKRLLAQAEARGELRGEVVLVPVANPIGLSQRLLHVHLGRFEATSGENFNRRYPDLFALVEERVPDIIGNDAAVNRRRIRVLIKEALCRLVPSTELESLRTALMMLAHDADVVLDMHCDGEAVLHIYTEAPYLEQAEPLYRYLGADTVLTARGSGAVSFDEAMSGIWWKLAERFDAYPIPLSCMAATVELRGKSDVDHDRAKADAAHLFAFMQSRGVIGGDVPVMPDARCQPTPLAGAETLRAPHAGVLVFVKHVGDKVAAGEVVAEIIDPLTDGVSQIRASVDGCLFARENQRYAVRGMDLCKIAGTEPFRRGNLLGA